MRKKEGKLNLVTEMIKMTTTEHNKTELVAG